jgi:predicted nucleic acid-binding protein
MNCVDASVAVKWLFAEEHSDKALALARHVARDGEALACPPLLPYEVTNVIRQRTRHTTLTLLQAKQLLATLFTFPISIGEPMQLHERALEIAHHYDLSAAYDAHYVALAEALSATLWTNDQDLLRDLATDFPFVRSISDYTG